MWINNCVGGLNYRAFFLMILAAFCNLLLYVLSLVVLTLQPAPAPNAFLPAFATAWVSGGINSIFVILLVNLILLHLYLLQKGISTYEFIMAQREQERK
jgi:palmitoyltransferase